MAENADITVEFLPIEQAHLQIELKIYKSLKKLLDENSEITIDGGALNVKLNTNTVSKYVLTKIIELQNELEKYNTKTPTTNIDFNSNTFIEKKPTNE